MENNAFIKEGKTMIDVLQNKMVIDINEYKRLVDLGKHAKYSSDDIDILRTYNKTLKIKVEEALAEIEELKQQIKEISKKVEKKNSWWKIWD